MYKIQVKYFGGDITVLVAENQKQAYEKFINEITTKKVNECYIKVGEHLLEAYIFPYNKNTQYV